MTFDWIIDQIVSRSDPAGRDSNTFVQDEIVAPLRLKDLWIHIPDSVGSRVAVAPNLNENNPPQPEATLSARAMPHAADLIPRAFERPDVQRACIAGVSGIFNARDEACFWAMLAGGGELDGVHLLSTERFACFSGLRINGDKPDPVIFGMPIPIITGGYWLGGHRVSSPRAIRHPGAGETIGWANPDQNLAVAICHNQMFDARDPEDDPILPIAKAVVASLGLEWRS